MSILDIVLLAFGVVCACRGGYAFAGDIWRLRGRLIEWYEDRITAPKP